MSWISYISFRKIFYDHYSLNNVTYRYKGEIWESSCLFLAAITHISWTYLIMDWLNLLAGVIHIIILMTCIIGNSITVTAIFRCKKFRTPYHIYLLNISISDIMLVILSVGFLVESVDDSGYIFGSYLCKIGKILLIKILSRLFNFDS